MAPALLTLWLNPLLNWIHLMLNKYKVTVTIKTDKGERLSHSLLKLFSNQSDVDRYLIGFADGLAVAYKGVILCGSTEKVNESKPLSNKA